MNDTNGHFQTLLRQLQEGSHEAARELAEMFGGHVLRCVRRRLHARLRRRYDSLDFAQIVWASVFLSPDKLAAIRTPDDFLRLLTGMARNKVAYVGRHEQTRKKDFRRVQSLDEADDIAGPHLISRDPTPSAVAICRERYDRLVAGENERDQQVVALRSEGNTFDEVAARLNIDKRTARRVIDRLRQTQQHALEPGKQPPRGSPAS